MKPKRIRTTPRYWRPLVRCPNDQLYYSEELLNHTAQHYGISVAEARKKLDAEDRDTEIWVNDLYQVEVTKHGGMVQLNIRRRDGTVDRDWRHFQEIKNQLVGPECEAIELYPAESRKVDTSNKYHLWAVPDPSFRFPVGWQTRDVSYDTGKCPGLKQRPL